MAKTKIIQFRIDRDFFEIVLNRAHSKGFVKYADYFRDLCARDNMADLKVHEKLNKIFKHYQYFIYMI